MLEQLDHDSIRGDHLTQMDAVAAECIADGWPEASTVDRIAHMLRDLYPHPWDGCLVAAKKIVDNAKIPREQYDAP